jgi:hypothetical protein
MVPLGAYLSVKALITQYIGPNIVDTPLVLIFLMG